MEEAAAVGRQRSVHQGQEDKGQGGGTVPANRPAADGAGASGGRSDRVDNFAGSGDPDQQRRRAAREAARQRYRGLSTAGRRKVLDELEVITGYHRKSLLRLLNRKAAAPSRIRRPARSGGAQTLTTRCERDQASG